MSESTPEIEVQMLALWDKMDKRQRQNARRLINLYQQVPREKISYILEKEYGISAIDTGPLDNPCPYCGRS